MDSLQEIAAQFHKLDTEIADALDVLRSGVSVHVERIVKQVSDLASMVGEVSDQHGRLSEATGAAVRGLESKVGEQAERISVATHAVEGLAEAVATRDVEDTAAIAALNDAFTTATAAADSRANGVDATLADLVQRVTAVERLVSLIAGGASVEPPAESKPARARTKSGSG